MAVTGETPALLDSAVERTPLADHDGRTGATLERVRLADGTRLVLKRSHPAEDLVALATGRGDRELALYQAGALDRLPRGVGHAIVAGWRDGTDIVVLMRDVATHIPGWTRPLDRAECRRLLGAAASLYATFGSEPVSGLVPLADRLTLLAPARMAPLAGGPNPLPALVLRGWQRFAELVEPQAADAVLALLDDPAPLVDALSAYPSTLLHGDLGLVNIALEPDRVTLLDWSLACWAPPVVEFVSFLAGNAGQVRASREQIVADYRAVAGGWQDDAGTALGFVAGLLHLGWNKALDAVEHPDPVKRARESADLGWWLSAAASGLAELRR